VAEDGGGKGRILIVDDEPALAEAVARVLTRAGYVTVCCSNGSEALQLLAAQSVDMIVSDVSMPGLKGTQLLQKVRERDPDLPVLLMTGTPHVDTAMEAVEYGALKYLTKPIDPDLLVSTVAHGLQLARLAAVRREAVRLVGGEATLAVDRAALGAALTRALDQLWMAFQPILSTTSRSIVAFEALLRCADPAFPHPGVMLEAAERLDRVWELGRKVRHEVAKWAVEQPSAQFFVNLHPSDLKDPELLHEQAPLVKVAKRVVLEITERASIDDVESLAEKVSRLRELGFRIAVDDLGAGYAGLSSFAQLEPEVVKLDMSLIREIDKSGVKRKVVSSMTQLCKDMGRQVVAEGIETAAERDVVIELGCDLLQGYWFAKPGRPFPSAKWG
jgi:EAL domain-containing protein (putative c-di-GMP-specific phosphodiesterase class I)/ActR/RegA family two-component response regulator